jgi:hypothetical protein
MLDNGYIYLAASRLALYRSPADWGLTIEVFGFSPRVGEPSTTIYTFASRIENRATAADFVSVEAYQNYLRNNPHNEMPSVAPIEPGNWQDSDDQEMVAANASEIVIRGRKYALPSIAAYQGVGIELADPPRIHVFELCRYLANEQRHLLLATPEERQRHLPQNTSCFMQLDEWHHPDCANDERASDSETFRQLAEALSTGDVARYRPTQSPNNHWRHWPEGGTL